MLPRLENGVYLLLFVTNIAAKNLRYGHNLFDHKNPYDVDILDNHDHSNDYTGGFLSRLLTSKNGPVVVFLEPSSSGSNEPFSLKDSLYEKDGDIGDYVPSPGEQDAYLLYSVLRSTQENEILDTKAYRLFERTKDVLRQAFNGRCERRQSCEVKCPPQKKVSCQVNCQMVFDELDICEPKKKKKPTQPPCGGGGPKTMPPKWLRMLTHKK